MKITAGLGSIDEYIRFAKAGADEFFSRVSTIFLGGEIRHSDAVNRRKYSATMYSLAPTVNWKYFPQCKEIWKTCPSDI